MSDVIPVVKWAGGKRQLIKELKQNLPNNIDIYCEPFLGGGALLFELKPNEAVVNDLNSELVNMYMVIRDNVYLLIDCLKTFSNNKEYFLYVRDWDRQEWFPELNNIWRAARILFLNRTCFNGLFRVNSSGQFNTSFGNYSNPDFVNETALLSMNLYLKSNNIEFNCTDYSYILEKVSASPHNNVFVYLDPPYDGNFSNYTHKGFSNAEQINLKLWCDYLNSKNIKFMLSNSSTDFIKKLYINYNIIKVRASRRINSNIYDRGFVEELIIKNY